MTPHIDAVIAFFVTGEKEPNPKEPEALKPKRVFYVEKGGELTFREMDEGILYTDEQLDRIERKLDKIILQVCPSYRYQGL